MPRMTLLIAGAAMAACALAVAGCHKSATVGESDARTAAEAAPVVQTATARSGQVFDAISVTGTLAPLPGHEAKVAPPFAGQLADVLVQPNQFVAKGQVVARMSTTQLEGQIQQAEATIAQNEVQIRQAQINALSQQATTQTGIAQAQAQLAGAQATLSSATTNFQREQRLFADGLVAQKDVDDAHAALASADATVRAQNAVLRAARSAVLTDAAKRQDVAVAQQQVRGAQGALRTLRAQTALAVIHAPVSGRVTAVSATAGETIDTSATIATIVDTRTLQLIIQAPQASAGKIRPGQTVSFTTEALPGHHFAGAVASIGGQVDAATGAIPVTVRVDASSGPASALRDDMVVRGLIRSPARLSVLVPNSAVVTDPNTGQTAVAVIAADATLRLTQVTIGKGRPVDPKLARAVEIAAGVHPGDTIATAGQYSLPDGTKVTAQSAPTGGTDAARS